jgi:lipopolysaccharide/colanic/teichoic acid biosynthesis glycosyltransferase
VLPLLKVSDSKHFETCFKDPPASTWILSRTRRILDVSIALLVLTVSAMPMLIIAASVRLTSNGSAIFSQERIGQRGRRFRIYKFRSMAITCRQGAGLGLTKSGDMRVTFLGRFLRRFKLDELPQFYNILRGDMSLIGPRPKLHQYAAMFNMPYRPGISGAATIFFRNEEEILRDVPTLELDLFYKKHTKPVKVRLDVCYMCKATPSTDMQMLRETFVSCVRRDRGSKRQAPVQPLPTQL